MSAEVQRLRALVEQLSQEKEDVRLQTDPNRKRLCHREDFLPQCDEEMQGWIQGQQRSASGHHGRPLPRSEDIPTLVSSAGMATYHPRTVFSDATCSGEHGEKIRVRCGMAGIRVGEAANPDPGQESCRRRPVSSSDDNDCAPLVSLAVASVSVLHALERDLAATQWEVSASVDISSGDECLVCPDVSRRAQFDEQVQPD